MYTTQDRNRIETMYSVITKSEPTAGYKVKRGLKLVHRFKWKMWYYMN